MDHVAFASMISRGPDAHIYCLVSKFQITILIKGGKSFSCEALM